MTDSKEIQLFACNVEGIPECIGEAPKQDKVTLGLSGNFRYYKLGAMSYTLGISDYEKLAPLSSTIECLRVDKCVSTESAVRCGGSSSGIRMRQICHVAQME